MPTLDDLHDEATATIGTTPEGKTYPLTIGIAVHKLLTVKARRWQGYLIQGRSGYRYTYYVGGERTNKADAVAYLGRA